MTNKLLKALAFIFVLATLAYSQIAELEGPSLPYLNQQLRESTRRLNSVESATVNTWPGILDLDSGGTGANLSDPDGDYFLWWDDSDGRLEIDTLEVSTDVTLGGNSDTSGTSEVFTSNGTWTVPPGITTAEVIIVGAGGGGGAGSDDAGGSGGGGGGKTVYARLFNLTPGAELAVSIGVGGAKGTGDGNNGGNGTASTLSASGTHEVIADFGRGGVGGNGSREGGAGGSATTSASYNSDGSDFDAPSQTGGTEGDIRAIELNAWVGGAGQDGIPSNAGGGGGGTMLGTGGNGGSWHGSAPTVSTSEYGVGGGGGGSESGGTNGANGVAGYCKIWWN